MAKKLKKIVHMFKKNCIHVVKFGDIMTEMPEGLWLFMVKRCLKAYGWYRVNDGYQSSQNRHILYIAIHRYAFYIWF